MTSSESRYRPQDEASLRPTLAEVPAVRVRLGGTPSEWTVREVGDGNLNLVFIVEGPAGGVAVKQALPYVRMVGESWPLPLSRSYYEHMALSEQARLCPGLTPSILHHDECLSLFVMELLRPHIIMRRGMVAGTVYPGFADAISTFLARTMFFTSDLALSAAEKKGRVAAFAGNTAMCRISEDLIFTEPYFLAANNRWTTPHLDGIAAEFRADAALKVAASRLKLKFLASTDVMLHGDLHTGSIMVTDTDTRVIDAEFAFYGPMGFDLGALIGNLLISCFSQNGHEPQPGERDSYCRWILEAIESIWTGFRRKLLVLWQEQPTGDAYPPSLFQDQAGQRSLAEERHLVLDRLFQDVLGFAGVEMIRRILGLAHNLDLELIEDPVLRATCETRALRLARRLLVETDQFRSIQSVTRAASPLPDARHPRVTPPATSAALTSVRA